MTLFRSKVWRPVDIALLKWSCILLGMIVGAYVPGFVKGYLWVFAIAAILLGIMPVVSYFRTDDADDLAGPGGGSRWQKEHGERQEPRKSS